VRCGCGAGTQSDRMQWRHWTIWFRAPGCASFAWSRSECCRRCTTSSRRARPARHPPAAPKLMLRFGYGRRSWGRQRPPTGPAVPRSSGLSLVMWRGVDELSQPVELPDRAYGSSGAASGGGRRIDGGRWLGVARHVWRRMFAGGAERRASSFRRRPRLGELHAAAQAR